MLKLNDKELKKASRILGETYKSMSTAFKVLSDVNRYRIFRVLAAEPELSVGNIAKVLNISLPLASQHIKILAHAKLLQKERDGKKVFPKLEHKNPFVQAMIKTI